MRPAAAARPCRTAPRATNRRVLSRAGQDFLNHVYAGAWRPLPPTFNAQKGMRRHHPGLWRRHWGDVAVLHYTDAKPWQRDHPGASVALAFALVQLSLPGRHPTLLLLLLPSARGCPGTPHLQLPATLVQSTSRTPTWWSSGGGCLRGGCSRAPQRRGRRRCRCRPHHSSSSTCGRQLPASRL